MRIITNLINLANGSQPETLYTTPRKLEEVVKSLFDEREYNKKWVKLMNEMHGLSQSKILANRWWTLTQPHLHLDNKDLLIIPCCFVRYLHDGYLNYMYWHLELTWKKLYALHEREVASLQKKNTLSKVLNSILKSLLDGFPFLSAIYSQYEQTMEGIVGIGRPKDLFTEIQVKEYDRDRYSRVRQVGYSPYFDMYLLNKTEDNGPYTPPIIESALRYTLHIIDCNENEEHVESEEEEKYKLHIVPKYGGSLFKQSINENREEVLRFCCEQLLTACWSYFIGLRCNCPQMQYLKLITALMCRRDMYPLKQSSLMYCDNPDCGHVDSLSSVIKCKELVKELSYDVQILSGDSKTKVPDPQSVKRPRESKKRTQVKKRKK